MLCCWLVAGRPVPNRRLRTRPSPSSRNTLRGRPVSLPLRLVADLDNLADEFDPWNGAGSAGAAMGHAAGDHRIGPVHAAGADPDQNFVWFRFRFVEPL